MDLEFTRGDTQFLKFQLKDGLGNAISPSIEDIIYFTVKQNQNSSKVLIQKKYPDNIEYQDGYFIFTLNSEDTSDLAYGTYQYDIELKSGDYVKTLAFGTITLTNEITHRRDE